MRFLLDVNIGTTVADALGTDGHDVARASVLYPTLSDEAILARAASEDRILVTRDSDFGTLVYREGSATPPAIIYVRFDPADVADMVARLMSILDFKTLRGHMTVIGPDHDRRRPFPARSTDHG